MIEILLSITLITAFLLEGYILYKKDFRFSIFSGLFVLYVFSLYLTFLLARVSSFGSSVIYMNTIQAILILYILLRVIIDRFNVDEDE